MKLFKRLMCMHHWLETGVPDDLALMNGKFVYVCRDCGKRKSFRNAPVNYYEGPSR